MDFFRQVENHQRFLCHPIRVFLCFLVPLKIMSKCVTIPKRQIWSPQECQRVVLLRSVWFNDSYYQGQRCNGSLMDWPHTTYYTGYQLLIQSKLVDLCSHMTLMHEKTLLIQPNFSSKKWRHVKKTHLIRCERVEKTFLIRFRFWKTILIGFWKRTLLIGFHFWKKHFWSGSNMFFRRVVIFSMRNWAGSKVFSHASASRDYIVLLDQTLDPRVYFSILFRILRM